MVTSLLTSNCVYHVIFTGVCRDPGAQGAPGRRAELHPRGVGVTRGVHSAWPTHAHTHLEWETWKKDFHYYKDKLRLLMLILFNSLVSHPGPPELLSERLGHSLQHVLGAAVDGQPGAGADPGLTGDEHHLAPLPSDHHDVMSLSLS